MHQGAMSLLYEEVKLRKYKKEHLFRRAFRSLRADALFMFCF